MEQLTLLLEGFPASPTAPLESGEVKRMSAIYGQKCLEQYARFPRVSSWAKTFAASLIGTEGWYSTRCALSWKVLGIKSRPLLYLRAVSVRPTEESGYGLLPTPMAQSRETTEEQTIERQKKYGGKTRAMYLENFAVMGMLPTPNAFDWNTPRKPETFKKAQERHKAKGVNLQNPLKQMAVMGILPTPQAQEGDKITGLENQDSITKRVREITGTTSQLNPRFVAEMMGFPPNWTELPFLSGEQKVSKPTETP